MEPISWKNEPDDHDYPAAVAYLSLMLKPHAVDAVIDSLKSAKIVTQKAKDILRASRLELLPPDDIHVASDLDKIERGAQLSPILLLRGDFSAGVALQIADGYHRVCASYSVDPNTDIPCRIADLG